MRMPSRITPPPIQPTCSTCKTNLEQMYWWKNGQKLEPIEGSYECTQCGKEVNIT